MHTLIQEPAMNEPVTLRLDEETCRRLDRLSKAMNRSRAALAAEAIRQFVDLNEWQIGAIKAGMDEADSGRFIDHDRLRAKWGKKSAAAADKPTRARDISGGRAQ